MTRDLIDLLNGQLMPRQHNDLAVGIGRYRIVVRERRTRDDKHSARQS